jgi:hypothetical protein
MYIILHTKWKNLMPKIDYKGEGGAENKTKTGGATWTTETS